MKLATHAFYVAIVIGNSQLCYNGIQVTIISITGLTCLFHVVHCPHVFKKANSGQSPCKFSLPPKFEHLPWKLANQIRAIPANGELYQRSQVRAISQVLLPTKTSFTANANQSNECTRSRHGSLQVTQGEKMIFTTVEIDFYHRGN